MGCGCGKASSLGPPVLPHELNAMIEEERRQSLEEQRDALIASVTNAIGNGNSNESAQR